MDDWEDKKILVAEDEYINFLLIKNLLRDTNIKIVHAINGKEAVMLKQQSKYDLILMDIKMPEMDGFEATAEIRKVDKDVVIIAQTAYAFKEDECLSRGFNDFIVKPFDQNRLKELILKYI